jgi:hypothetical protein
VLAGDVDLQHGLRADGDSECDCDRE